MRKLIVFLFLFVSISAYAQDDPKDRQDYLRGSVTKQRSWWDLQHYKLDVEFMPDKKMIRGTNTIKFKTLKASKLLQLDLQEPLKITSVKHKGQDIRFERDGNVYWISFKKVLKRGKQEEIVVSYEGIPRVAPRPPWDGGITWTKDKKGNPWIVTTCQGIGASIWWPNKDHGYDEPDKGVQVNVTVPEGLVAVSNGRLRVQYPNKKEKTRTFEWVVKNPINNYTVNVNIGNYVHFGEKFQGEGGELDLDYWVLEHQLEKAKETFKEVPRTIKAFEHWFGKYPFYEDSFKIVTVPYAGMEHQSSVTYGNGFKNGYLGRDLSGTGVGFLFDFIIVHEAGHEWFGNNISMRDTADMWIHEGFTNYSENLFVEYHFGKEKGHDYVVGTRRGIQNKSPVIGTYNMNKRGSGDMYPKGGNLLHTIRHIIDNDEKWRSILRGLNKDFWHKTVTTEQIETYISKKAKIDLSAVFHQYLRTIKIPSFEYKSSGNSIEYRWANVSRGFDMPVDVWINGKEVRLKPTEKWAKLRCRFADRKGRG